MVYRALISWSTCKLSANLDFIWPILIKNGSIRTVLSKSIKLKINKFTNDKRLDLFKCSIYHGLYWLGCVTVRLSNKITKTDESNADTNCNWSAWNGHGILGKGIGIIGNQKKNQDRPDYSIGVIAKNAQKRSRVT